MGTTPSRRLVLAAATLALVATGTAAPAQARPSTTSRMAVAISRPATHPPSSSAERSSGDASTWATPVRTFTRSAVMDPAVAEVVRLVNVARADAGCRALRVDTRLATAARLHSEDMARQSYFSHTSLDGRTPWDRMRTQGYTNGSGENIAAGYGTPAAVMTGWMNSSGHRANILNCSSAAIGVGIGKGGSYGTYWTQDFGYS